MDVGGVVVPSSSTSPSTSPSVTVTSDIAIEVGPNATLSALAIDVAFLTYLESRQPVRTTPSLQSNLPIRSLIIATRRRSGSGVGPPVSAGSSSPSSTTASTARIPHRSRAKTPACVGFDIAFSITASNANDVVP